MEQARLGYWLRVVGLPVLLVLLTATVLGSHYETNDDFCLTLLLRGRTAAAPVTNLHLYFHGWAWVLARLYQLAPAVPWYGLTLYALLTLALVLLTSVLERLLAPHTTAWPRAALLTVFLVLAGLEHAQWFNYLRVPLLLSGAGLLWAAQQPAARRWVLPVSLLLFAAAWAIRPSAAVLGAALVAPAAWWLAGRRAGRVVAGFGAVALLLGLLVQLTRSPEATRYRRLDVLKSAVLDYGWQVPAPHTRADSLAVQAVAEWSFGDSTLVDEALFRRAYRPAPWAKVLPGKAFDAFVLVVRDYFPLLILNALLLALGLNLPAALRRRQWLYVLGGVGLLLGLALALKLPPRLAGPLLTLFTVAHAAGVLRQPLRLPKGRPLRPLLLAALLGLYLLKVGHRRQVLAAEEQQHRRFVQALGAHRAGPLVGMQVEEQFKSLSPFRQYVPAAGPPWLLLTGWPTLDPSQARLRQQLTGSRNQREALRRLRRRPGVRWQNVHLQLPPKRREEL
ncbi:hypothetical protein EJV47_05270 [Hymenobacter gummosus]|uniref:Glycosyltransferase RgtA/B/C/D-like domain-containing protein n=1 Tax=Hymenobacter gummosus TaxID=1776032 RepID=A0A3S0JGI3_9BACT|nr:hypothetical protein [Hymenobacter gummosus]RTQ52425.1 hypothetical protein EJV47_05270 [Hymenobacter gummosus]